MSLVLISRTMVKLEICKNEIKRKYPNIDIKVVQADYSRVDIYDHIENELKGLDIGMLVNNVGSAMQAADPLHEQSRSTIETMLNMNVSSVAMMSEIVIHQMKRKRKGEIINIGSGSALTPPIYIVYSTVKSWVRRFSYGLRLQYNRYGIIVQNVEPFFVKTKLATDNLAVKKMIDPETCAVQSLKTVGHYDETHGAIRHDVVGAILSLLPESLAIKTMPLGVEEQNTKKAT